MDRNNTRRGARWSRSVVVILIGTLLGMLAVGSAANAAPAAPVVRESLGLGLVAGPNYQKALHNRRVFLGEYDLRGRVGFCLGYTALSANGTWQTVTSVPAANAAASAQMIALVQLEGPKVVNNLQAAQLEAALLLLQGGQAFLQDYRATYYAAFNRLSPGATARINALVSLGKANAGGWIVRVNTPTKDIRIGETRRVDVQVITKVAPIRGVSGVPLTIKVANADVVDRIPTTTDATGRAWVTIRRTSSARPVVSVDAAVMSNTVWLSTAAGNHQRLLSYTGRVNQHIVVTFNECPPQVTFYLSCGCNVKELSYIGYTNDTTVNHRVTVTSPSGVVIKDPAVTVAPGAAGKVTFDTPAPGAKFNVYIQDPSGSGWGPLKFVRQFTA